jgi:CPA2 family monovalent cation:H+ antiporter-2
MQVIIHSVIIVAIVLLSNQYVLPMVEHTRFGRLIVAAGTLVTVAPFLWALSLRRVAVEQVRELLAERKYRGPIIMMILFRFILALVFIGFLLDSFFSRQTALITFFAVIVLYIIFPKKLNAQYHRIENHFLKNFNARDILKAKRRRSDLTPWDGHMSFFDIAKESNIVGKTLKELKMREQFGINIVFIKRGDINIKMPSRNERLFPGDEICAIGTDVQLKEFKKYLDQNEIEPAETVAEDEIVLRQVDLTQEEYIGKTIRQSKLREKTNGLIVGLERRGMRILNPESTEILERDDILWIVGDRRLLAQLMRS